jgi:hypothetical protein
MVAGFASERKGRTNDRAQRRCRPHESLGGASAATEQPGGNDDSRDREEAGHHGEPDQRDHVATIGDLEVDANGLGKRSGEGVATVAASVATKPVPASLQSRWVWLVWPDAAPATTPMSFMRPCRSSIIR